MPDETQTCGACGYEFFWLAADGRCSRCMTGEPQPDIAPTVRHGLDCNSAFVGGSCDCGLVALRADAELGRLLREALETVPRYGHMRVEHHLNGRMFVSPENNETRALSAALSARARDTHPGGEG
jgi:hypothetical protein